MLRGACVKGMQDTEIYVFFSLLLLYVSPELGTSSGMGLNTGVKLSPLLLGNLEIMRVTS